MPDNTDTTVTPDIEALRTAIKAMQTQLATIVATDHATMNIHQAVTAVMREIRAVGKDGVNKAQKFNYRGIDAVVNEIAPLFQKYGVFTTSEILNVSYEKGSSNGGGGLNRTYLTVKYTIHGPAGDSLSSMVVAESMDSGDKATAKAMSVAWRTFLLQILCMPTCDPDPDAASYADGQELRGGRPQTNERDMKRYQARAENRRAATGTDQVRYEDQPYREPQPANTAPIPAQNKPQPRPRASTETLAAAEDILVKLFGVEAPITVEGMGALGRLLTDDLKDISLALTGNLGEMTEWLHLARTCTLREAMNAAWMYTKKTGTTVYDGWAEPVTAPEGGQLVGGAVKDLARTHP